jgi:hypothetical protein
MLEITHRLKVEMHYEIRRMMNPFCGTHRHLLYMYPAEKWDSTVVE